MKPYSYPYYAPWYEERENIKDVVINKGVTSIGEGAFSYCSRLQAIDFGGSEEMWKSIEGSDNVKITVNFGA